MKTLIKSLYTLQNRGLNNEEFNLTEQSRAAYLSEVTQKKCTNLGKALAVVLGQNEEVERFDKRHLELKKAQEQALGKQLRRCTCSPPNTGAGREWHMQTRASGLGRELSLGAQSGIAII